MSLKLYAHPFSSYCQKALVAIYENSTPFEWKMLSPEQPENYAEFADLWPLRRFPILVDGKRTITEASTIIEYLDLYHPGPAPMLPDDRKAALEVRAMDRFFDNYISTPQQRIVFDVMRPGGQRDPCGVIDCRQMLDTAYAWLDKVMAGREWAPVSASASPTAAPPRSCSTPTGPTPSRKASRMCTPIGDACLRVPRSPAPSTRPAPTAHCFPSAHPTATDPGEPHE